MDFKDFFYFKKNLLHVIEITILKNTMSKQTNKQKLTDI